MSGSKPDRSNRGQKTTVVVKSKSADQSVPAQPVRSRLGLSAKVIVAALLMVVVVVSVNYVVFLKGYRKDTQVNLMQKAAAFTAVADESKNHTTQLHKLGAFDGDKLLAEALEHVKAGGSYKDTKFYATIPVVAGWSAAQEAAKREGIDFKVPAYQARNKENEVDPKSFRGQLLTELAKQVESGGEKAIGRIDSETNTLHYMRAITLSEGCMACHGDPAKYDTRDASGGFDGKDPLGFAMEGWKPGDMHGAYEVVMPLAGLDAQVAGFLTSGLAISVPLVAVAGGLFIVGMRKFFAAPLRNLISMVNDLASGDGDLTKRLSLNRGDEIGLLAHGIDRFTANLHSLMTDVSKVTTEVAGAATEISASAEQMSTGLSRQEQQSQQVSAAISEMAASVSEVARKSGEASNAASTSKSDADAGAEVVRQTVSEIQAISDEVSRSAKSVTSLGTKSEQIGQVINVINDIADQTNLLALNAAIEAARAGEHGRGFAVVADEVRKLAERTTKATEEVASSIREIQTETTRAVQQIECGSGRVIKGVELANSAGSALERIHGSSSTVSTMIEAIAAASDQQSSASDQIARSVEQINAVTRESSDAASQVAKAATMLSEQSETLSGLVGRFKI